MSPVIQPDTSEMVDFTPIEPNTYPAKITKITYKVSEKKKTPMIEVTFNVTVAEGDVRPRTAYQVIQGKGSQGFDQLLRACHFDDVADVYADPDQENPPFDTDRLVEQELDVVIEHQIYQGATRDTISGYLRR